MLSTDVYSGNHFSVGGVGGEWTIWRYCGHDGEREQVILSTDAMDELRDYFAECYAEDRQAVVRA